MKITKRIFAVILALSLATTVFTVSASATGTASGNETMAVQVSTDKTTYDAGDTVTVSISVSNNYNATCMRFPVMFSSDVFEIPTSISLTAYNDCLTYKGSLSSNTTNDGSFIPSTYDTTSYGCVLLQWVASVSAGTVGYFNESDATKCFTFQLKVKATASGKSGTVFIPSESDLFYYQAINTPTDATTIYKMDKASCPMTFSPANVTVNAGDPIDIVAQDGSTAVIDKTNNFIYGLSEGLSRVAIKNAVKATGTGATLSITMVSGAGYGTGTTVDLVVDASIVATYYVALFGDVNSDAYIDSADTSMNDSVAQGLAEFSENGTSALDYAADLNKDGVVDSSDTALVDSAAQGIASINQSTGLIETA